MARYIDADLLMQKLSRMIDYCKKDNKVNGLTALFQVGDAIIDCPTTDVAEVKHAKWEICCDGYYPYCSNCKTEPKNGVMSKYCPECGAKMDGRRDT